MIHKHLNFYAQHIKQDIPAGIVVFLVALPLCLGVAMASGAPLFAGLIAGMIGGLVISWTSGSQLSVSGPAAGLTVIVLNAIEQLGSYAGFLVAVVLAGILQLIFGYLRGGIIGAFFPSAVIKGMLAAIGIILIMKQIPYAVGYNVNFEVNDVSFEGNESYMMEAATSSLQELVTSFSAISIGSTLIAGVALLIIMIWETSFMKRFALVRLFPGALIAVMWGIGFNILALDLFPEFAVTGEQVVTLPITTDINEFIQLFALPDFSFLSNPNIYFIALTLAIIASLETLLSLEAVDKIDPLKRIAPTNRELKAQGLGNIISGMIGGLPITSVIVRSAANINAGGQTRIASFVHGLLLVLSVMYMTTLLNLIPLACLAAILLQTGYKLAKPKLFIDLYKQGWGQFLPFIITVIAILITDLLQGIIIGIAVGLYFVIRANYHASISLKEEDNHFTLTLHKDISFLNKALLRKMLLQITENSTVTIDARQAQFIDHDIREIFQDYLTTAPDDNITVEIIGLDD
ncbi:MAG: SulP family inorganic anion transporter [Methyloprofundus sp.]|nr:SulP family inorganic anion transporter [Methyloprofundus sp.]MBW6452158.1 SulP family inorganic anion transporter [Methyloprofundus sp.]